MNHRIQGKTILITGASRGLGEQIAYKCAESGANLILTARSMDKLEKMKDIIVDKYGVQVATYRLDVGDRFELEERMDTIIEQNRTIDVLVNNAGFGKFKYLVDTSIEEAEEMFRVNVLGLITVTKKVLPTMMNQKSGHVINIASQAGKLATPKSSIYAATKGAVIKFSDSIRMEVQKNNIFVTTINPGPIHTNFFDIADETGKYLQHVGRWGLDPELLAEKIVMRMFVQTREINLPKLMNFGSILHALFPNVVEKLGKRAFNKK